MQLHIEENSWWKMLLESSTVWNDVPITEISSELLRDDENCCRLVYLSILSLTQMLLALVGFFPFAVHHSVK